MAPPQKKGYCCMKVKKSLSLLLCTALALALLAGCSKKSAGGSSGSASGSGSGAGGPFSSFTADTLDGGTFSQDEIQAKDLTIINFWGMFCNPCRAEMPDLAAYAKALPDNVQLITICIDALDDLEGTQEFLDSCGYEGVTLVNGDETFISIASTIQAFPTTVFVNSQGEIVGDTIEGNWGNLAESYTEAANKVLKAEGKAEFSLEE